MSRSKGYAVEEARASFRKELEKCMIDADICGKAELAQMASMKYRTLYRRFESIDDIRLSELRDLVKVLRPNPMILLRLVGYSVKDIQRALGTTQNMEKEQGNGI